MPNLRGDTQNSFVDTSCVTVCPAEDDPQFTDLGPLFGYYSEPCKNIYLYNANRYSSGSLLSAISHKFTTKFLQRF